MSLCVSLTADLQGAAEHMVCVPRHLSKTPRSLRSGEHRASGALDQRFPSSPKGDVGAEDGGERQLCRVSGTPPAAGVARGSLWGALFGERRRKEALPGHQWGEQRLGPRREPGCQLTSRQS